MAKKNQDQSAPAPDAPAQDDATTFTEAAATAEGAAQPAAAKPTETAAAGAAQSAKIATDDNCSDGPDAEYVRVGRAAFEAAKARGASDDDAGVAARAAASKVPGSPYKFDPAVTDSAPAAAPSTPEPAAPEPANPRIAEIRAELEAIGDPFAEASAMTKELNAEIDNERKFIAEAHHRIGRLQGERNGLGVEMNERMGKAAALRRELASLEG